MDITEGKKAFKEQLSGLLTEVAFALVVIALGGSVGLFLVRVFGK